MSNAITNAGKSSAADRFWKGTGTTWSGAQARVSAGNTARSGWTALTHSRNQNVLTYTGSIPVNVVGGLVDKIELRLGSSPNTVVASAAIAPGVDAHVGDSIDVTWTVSSMYTMQAGYSNAVVKQVLSAHGGSIVDVWGTTHQANVQNLMLILLTGETHTGPSNMGTFAYAQYFRPDKRDLQNVLTGETVNKPVNWTRVGSEGRISVLGSSGLYRDFRLTCPVYDSSGLPRRAEGAAAYAETLWALSVGSAGNNRIPFAAGIWDQAERVPTSGDGINVDARVSF